MDDIDKEDIKRDLKKLGIKPGDKIMVHSSLSSIGHVKGGPGTVCRALMETVTDKGVLMMPSFNHDKPFRKGGPGYYSPLETPTSNGTIPQRFWQMKNVFRSLNPTHPFAVWGKDAESYVKNHHKVITMGKGSPMHLLEQKGGKVILVNVTGANTFHHVVEMTNNVPCLGKRTEEYPVKLPSGKMIKLRTWGWRNGPCPVNDSEAYIPVMKKKGLIKQGKIGNAKTLVFKMKDSRQVIEKLLKKACRGCKVRPRICEYTVNVKRSRNL